MLELPTQRLTHPTLPHPSSTSSRSSRSSLHATVSMGYSGRSGGRKTSSRRRSLTYLIMWSRRRRRRRRRRKRRPSKPQRGNPHALRRNLGGRALWRVCAFSTTSKASSADGVWGCVVERFLHHPPTQPDHLCTKLVRWYQRRVHTLQSFILCNGEDATGNS